MGLCFRGLILGVKIKLKNARAFIGEGGKNGGRTIFDVLRYDEKSMKHMCGYCVACIT